MARPAKLTVNAIETELKQLTDWDYRDGKLNKVFKFTDFIEAWGFMSRVALIAQTMDHHPDWSNIYNTVQVELSTHDAGGVTQLDIELARAMDLHS